MRRTALLLAAAGAAACRPSGPPVVAELPEFTMTAVRSSGEVSFTRADLAGRVWLASFIFTRCGGPCPALAARMAGLQRELPPEVGLLTVTVDPDWDTPARLRAYAARYGARSPRWEFLRGSTSDTYNLLYAGFRQPMSVDPQAPPETRVQHSTRFVLIDRKARVRGFYDGLGDADNAAAVRDARRLLEEGT